MLDDYRPPTLKERLLHPVSIAAILLTLVVGGFWGWGAYQDMRRAALQEAIAPLDARWRQIAAGAPPRLARFEAILADAPPADALSAREQPCEGVEGTVEVVHRPLLQALAAGQSHPNIEGPSWLSSDAYRDLAGSISPGMNVERYRQRNEEVTDALARPCLGVLETEHAEDARLEGKASFAGGAVVGWLSVVCLDSGRLHGQVRVLSQPWLAVSVKQSSPGSQASANAAAVSDSARLGYWRAMDKAMAKACPAVTVRTRAPRSGEG